ncbi:MAG: sulfotransferase family 2 domain-containing protein, partial [Armatimonadota bacterium]
MLQPVRRLVRTVSHPHFSPYRCYVDRECRTVVVLNPKVGTTTFRHVICHGLREVRGYADPSQGRYRPFHRARDFAFAPVRDYFHALGHPEEYSYYCFVRNPYARLRSAWLDKMAFGHEEGYPPSVRRRHLHN